MILDRELETTVGRNVDNSKAIFLALNDVDSGSSNCRASDVAANSIDGSRVGNLRITAFSQSFEREDY